MKKILNLFSFLLIAGICHAQLNETALVKASFDNYKKAILNEDGEEAIKYLDTRTTRYYADMLEKAKTADSATVDKLELLDKMMVFSLRHRTSKEDLLSFDEKSLLRYAIKQGMIGKSSVVNTTIGDINISDNSAKGEFVINDQKTPFFFHFYKEENVWKIDLTSILTIARLPLQKVLEESGESENEFIFTILEMSTGNKPTSAIWIAAANK